MGVIFKLEETKGHNNAMLPIKLTVQLFRIISNRDGGGRILLDFGSDSLEAIQQLQTLNAKGDINLAAVFVPFEETNFDLPGVD